MKLIFKTIGFFILAELLLLVVAFCMMWFGNNFAAAMEFIWTVTVDLVSGTKFHIAGLITSSVFWMFLYFKKVYKSKEGEDIYFLSEKITGIWDQMAFYSYLFAFFSISPGFALAN